MLPQLSPRNLGLRGSPVTFHTMKMFVDVGNHSNQSGANPCGRGCGKCSMSSKSQSISGSDLEPKKIDLFIYYKHYFTLACSVEVVLSSTFWDDDATRA